MIALNILTFVSLLAIVSLGLTIVFGLMGVINLAHGEFITVGAYSAAVVQLYFGQSADIQVFFISLVVAAALGAVIGLAIEFAVVSHLYARPLDTILATFAISLILQKLIDILFGSQPQIVSAPLRASVELFGAAYPAYRLLVIAVAAACVTGVLFAFARMQVGTDLRAIIQNRTMAEALGLDTRRISRLAFAGGSALAAIAGVLIAPMATVEAHMGLAFLAKAFLVVILGGIGSVGGTVAASILIGGSETALNYLVDPSLASAIVLIGAVLLIRVFPRGLLAGYSAAHHLTGRG